MITSRLHFFLRSIVIAFSSPFILSNCLVSVSFTDLATPFQIIAEKTQSMPMSQRVAAIESYFQEARPGLYHATQSSSRYRRIARALQDFPAIRKRYDEVVRNFPTNLRVSVQHFRHVFPNFEPPMPIILAHDLGERDGGSARIGGRKVMIFGADLIAKYHDEATIRPFIDHELFHLEHARYFADCDQLWCPLWQEGLATDAASTMNPGATDHQLILDIPRPIRAESDANWNDALCRVSNAFDSDDPQAISDAFLGSRHPVGLPPRYGYYVGFRIAMVAQREVPIQSLVHLNDEAARPVVRRALISLIKSANAPCGPPSRAAKITHSNPRAA
jgi:hypothetical protein